MTVEYFPPSYEDPIWKTRQSYTLTYNPSELRTMCEMYFQWVYDNPIKEQKTAVYYGKVITYEENRLRAMTRQGLCLFLGITPSTFSRWKKEDTPLKEVVEWAEMVMYEQKFTAAAANVLNQNIVMRELGLAERQIQDTNLPEIIIAPPDGEPRPPPPIYNPD